MKPKRSAVDWALEAVSLAAVIATVAVAAAYWPRIAARAPLHLRIPRAWNPKTALWIMLGIDVGTYLLLTAAARFQRLIYFVPAEMGRSSPQVRQLLLSMIIVLKAVMALLSAYLVWALVKVMLGHARSLNPRFLTLFVLCVPVPLILYTVKLRRYRR
jgi:hypothetical protein